MPLNQQDTPQRNANLSIQSAYTNRFYSSPIFSRQMDAQSILSTSSLDKEVSNGLLSDLAYKNHPQPLSPCGEKPSLN
jgi:hypothetical protein